MSAWTVTSCLKFGEWVVFLNLNNHRHYWQFYHILSVCVTDPGVKCQHSDSIHWLHDFVKQLISFQRLSRLTLSLEIAFRWHPSPFGISSSQPVFVFSKWRPKLKFETIFHNLWCLDVRYRIHTILTGVAVNFGVTLYSRLIARERS